MKTTHKKNAVVSLNAKNAEIVFVEHLRKNEKRFYGTQVEVASI